MRIRNVGKGDAPVLLAWRNDPETRQSSANTAEVTEAEHREWLAQSLQRTDRVLLLAEEQGEAVGTVRFDRTAPGVWDVSITIAPAHRRAGRALVVLNAAEQYLAEDHDIRELHAKVRNGNVASLALFDRAGYRRYAADEEHIQLRRMY